MKIVIGGQMGKNEIKQIVLETAGADTQVEIKDDISAAMDIKVEMRICIWEPV